MSDSRVELYVYYRVATANASAALEAVRAFQQQLRRGHAGLSTRVLQRVGERDDAVTLMEIYAFDAAGQRGVSPALLADIERAAANVAPLLTSPRRVERFDALD